MNLDVFGLTDNEYVILQALHATISKTPLTRKDYWSFEGGRRDVHLQSPVYSRRQGRYVYPLTDKTISKLLNTERKLILGVMSRLSAHTLMGKAVMSATVFL